jgi:transposase
VKRYDLEFKSQLIKEASEASNATIVAKKHGVPVGTIHTWMNSNASKKVKEDTKSFKSLQKKLAEKELENQILKDLLKKTVQVWSNE